VPILIDAIKELKAELDAEKAINDAQEREIDELRDEIIYPRSPKPSRAENRAP
jgi:hypothetical protein